VTLPREPAGEGDARDLRVLTVNTGSSSAKLGVYAVGEGERLLLSGTASRLGLPGGGLEVSRPGDTTPPDRTASGTHGDALAKFLDLVGEEAGGRLDAVGHRIVHGGPHYAAPVRVTPEVLDDLRGLEELAPDHLPQAVAAIEAVSAARPGLTHIACFDTAFHRTLPPVAQLVPLPRGLGVERFGFHGLSYEYVLSRLRELDPASAGERVLLAHLGNGASMAAIRGGVCVETTMGFTPAGGLVMGTRPGDLDPGVLVHLARTQGLDADALDELINKRAGLLGVSGLSPDMKDLLESDSPAAAEAVELFCYQARKFVGALSAVLGGLDTLVFTGGIGEHAATIRGRICAGLGYLGLAIDPERNAEHAPILSAPESDVTLRVIATDEDLMIARHTRDLVAAEAGARG
jgi:acetate kinase